MTKTTKTIETATKVAPVYSQEAIEANAVTLEEFKAGNRALDELHRPNYKVGMSYLMGVMRTLDNNFLLAFAEDVEYDTDGEEMLVFIANNYNKKKSQKGILPVAAEHLQTLFPNVFAEIGGLDFTGYKQVFMENPVVLGKQVRLKVTETVHGTEYQKKDIASRANSNDKGFIMWEGQHTYRNIDCVITPGAVKHRVYDRELVEYSDEIIGAPAAFAGLDGIATETAV